MSKLHLIRFALVLINIALLGTYFTICAWSNEPAQSFKPTDWKPMAPRDEIRPTFSMNQKGGPSEQGSLVIEHDTRKGLDGWYQKSFEVTSGNWYEFHAMRQLTNVSQPRRSALVRILWQDSTGQLVSANVPESQSQELGHVPSAEPEHPVDGSTDTQGWTSVRGVYQVPPKATRAIIELHLQWAPNGKVEWSQVEFLPCEPLASRIVKLAAIHYKPSGKSPLDNCKEFVPLLEKAAEQKVDLVVMGETVPSVNTKLLPHEIAEPIPGPTTDFFGEVAKKYGLHLVLSLYEREDHLVYNTAILMGPDGRLIGKYRKVCLPHGEAEKGVAPGEDYPVFETSLGKIGMMVCYDGFFPEVARELSNRGAEIIAWPVWGCNPLLARARACENHVYLVSSTFMAPRDGWMLSAIYDQAGKPIASAEQWGEISIAEVDLNRPYIGPWNLGDFRAMIPRHRPPTQLPPVDAHH